MYETCGISKFDQGCFPSDCIIIFLYFSGCGDAYRAGLLFGLMNDLDIETTGRIASLLGSIKIASAGTQNHSFTKNEFDALFEKEFGYSL